MLNFVTTADGSKTIFNSEVGENYHSKHGALQESLHVFVGAGLTYFLDRSNAKELSILEVGFGTGLNFLLSADHCTEKQIHLDYTGIEAYPLTSEMIGQTGYDQYLSQGIWTDFLTNYVNALNGLVELNTFCRLHIDSHKLLDFESTQQFDVIYFDAFAAAHQPEMWGQAAIGPIIALLKPGGVFVTYAITGDLKRLLKGLGMEVQKVRGAPGKREMLRAIRPII